MQFIKVIIFLAVLAISVLNFLKGVSIKREGRTIVGIEGFHAGRLLASMAYVTIAVILLSTIIIVPAGHRGVIFSQAVGVEKRILGEGLSVVVPLLESVVLTDVRVDKEVATGTAASKDLQDVTAEVLVNYNADPSKVNLLYQKIGDIEAVKIKIIAPAVQEIVKSVTPKFTAAEIIQKRHKVKELIYQGLALRLARSYLLVTDISIVDIKFNPEYTHEIEEKAKQEQIAQREELIVRQREAQAKQAIATAEGDKKSAVLRAEGQSEANRLLAESITPTVIQLRYLEKWDGKLPMYMAGDAGSTLLVSPPKQ